MSDFDKTKKFLCPDCETPYEENVEGILVCPNCGRIESEAERTARFIAEAKRKLNEENTDFRSRSEFEKFAKEINDTAFERKERVKIAEGEFDSTATSAESGALLKHIKEERKKAQEAADERRAQELLLEEERVQREHDRRLAQEAKARLKEQILEGQMPFELLLDDGLVKMYFGRYPQERLTDERLTAILDEKINAGAFVRNEQGWFRLGENMYAAIPANPYDTNSYFDDGARVENGKYYYFKVQPIKWRVLAVRDDEALLLSDKVLSVKDFNADKRTGMWSESYLHDWLNTRFFARAFTPSEQKWIKLDRVDNTSTAHKLTKKFAGEDTEDTVFLLSHAEAIKRAMGFSIVTDKRDPERRAYPTDYARALGATCCTDEEYKGCTNWWLRSPGTTERSATSVEPSGKINLLFGVIQKMGVRAVVRVKPYVKDGQ